MSTTRLDRAYDLRVKAIRARVDAFALARFGAGQYRDADVERFVAEVVPVVLAGRRQVSALTDAWLAAKLAPMLGRKVRPRGPIDTDALRGVPADEVYRRPYKTVWWKLAEGAALETAVSAATARVTDLVVTDMQLAKTSTVRAVFEATPEVTGYRRTLTGKSCQLCSDAARQRYHRGDLMPIHPGCDCGVEPLTESAGRVIDAKTVAVREHGEIGPLLTVPSHHFDGPSVAA